MATQQRQWDMSGRTVLVTGGTAGIGYATAGALASAGAHVIITGRDAGHGQQAATALGRDCGSDSVTFLQAEHSTVGGNQQLADQVRDSVPSLDVLINNVGGLYDTRRETADGYEATLAMNFVGPFTLTNELLSLLLANPPARCVNVVSAAFRMYKGDPFDDVQSTARFVGADAYGQTKLLNLLIGLALARRLDPDQLAVNLVHPGVTWTEMTRSSTPRTMPSARWIWPILRLVQRHGTPAKAARRVMLLAAAPEVQGHTGEYFERKPTGNRLSARELDPEIQDRAWQLASDLLAKAPTNRRPGAHPGLAAANADIRQGGRR